MSSLLDPLRVWTFDDLQALPDDGQNDIDWRRYEIVDGALVVSPAAGVDHEYVLDRLRETLKAQVPVDLWASGPLGVDLDASYRIPDLVVLSRRLIGASRNLLRPDELSLAVEVVSPTSRITDRVTKPAQYAAAGIACYWRVEMEPTIVLAAYRLPVESSTYIEIGTWGEGDTAELDAPFPIRVEIDDLVPRP